MVVGCWKQYFDSILVRLKSFTKTVKISYTIFRGSIKSILKRAVFSEKVTIILTPTTSTEHQMVGDVSQPHRSNLLQAPAGRNVYRNAIPQTPSPSGAACREWLSVVYRRLSGLGFARFWYIDLKANTSATPIRFDSILVRLKGIRRWANLLWSSLCFDSILVRLKVCSSWIICPTSTSFDSILVRLKVDVARRLQDRFAQVSIPYWFD